LNTQSSIETTVEEYLLERENGARGRTATVIRPPGGRPHLNLRELWSFRDLIYMLIVHELKKRYKQTVVGVTWVVFQPVLVMFILSIFFGRIAQIPSDGVPYPIFVYCALVPWSYFVHALTKSTISLVELAAVITKVYFPRLVIPISAVLAGMVDFFIASLFLFGMMVFYGIAPTAAFLTLPIFLFLTVATALGVGLWLSVVNVKFRDVANVLPFLTQTWFFITPVFYPTSMIPESWRLVYGLNPMTGVVDGFRWAVLGTVSPPGLSSLISAGMMVLLVIGGLYYFRFKEDYFADEV